MANDDQNCSAPVASRASVTKHVVGGSDYGDDDDIVTHGTSGDDDILYLCLNDLDE